MTEECEQEKKHNHVRCIQVNISALHCGERERETDRERERERGVGGGEREIQRDRGNIEL